MQQVLTTPFQLGLRAAPVQIQPLWLRERGRGVRYIPNKRGKTEHGRGEVGATAQTLLVLFIISTVPIAGGRGRQTVCVRRGRGLERGFVFLLPFLLRATFEVVRLSRPVLFASAAAVNYPAA